MIHFPGPEVLQRVFLGNTWAHWLWALGIFLAVLLALGLARRWGRQRLRRIAASTKTMADDIVIDILDRTRPVFLLAVSAWSASHALELSDRLAAMLRAGTVLVLLIQIGLWATTALVSCFDVFRQKRIDSGDALTWLSAIEWAGKAIIWLFVLTVGLEKLGVDVAGLATGFGIGGVAVALAVQSVLGDFFSAFAIYLDKPFVLGDFLAVGDFRGTVEQIGLKTTRLRSLNGEQLVFSNSDLLSSRIQNFGRLVERRASFTVGVTYDTPEEKVKRIPRLIREVVEGQEKARFERSHFREFGDSALLMETVYFVQAPAYEAYMDVRQAVNLELMRRFAAEGIEFAYPTQTILLNAATGNATTGNATTGNATTGNATTGNATTDRAGLVS